MFDQLQHVVRAGGEADDPRGISAIFGVVVLDVVFDVGILRLPVERRILRGRDQLHGDVFFRGDMQACFVAERLRRRPRAQQQHGKQRKNVGYAHETPLHGRMSLGKYHRFFDGHNPGAPSLRQRLGRFILPA